MAKGSVYVCQQCGTDFPKWSGKCPNCGEWNTLVEMREPKTTTRGKSKSTSSKAQAKQVQSIDKVKKNSAKRNSTNIEEFDRVLGGGLVDGQVLLIAGEPGVGKSTLLLQFAQEFKNVLYISGEESIGQIKIRADRLGVDDPTISILEETDVDVIVATIEKTAAKSGTSAVVIDSVQTLFTSDLAGIPGSVGQVRECSMRLIRLCKSLRIPLILVGHVTKQGSVAGPSTLTHMVDTVLWFEGEKIQLLRVVRALKNRFGATDEIGVFEMKDGGLVGITGAEDYFLDDAKKRLPGSCITCVMEGTRPILVEIQALVIPSKLAIPRRVVQGLDPKRVELILAVLTKHCGLHLSERDVYVNVVGGLRINDPGADLAIAASISSSYRDKPIKNKTVVFGEVGLLGEVRDPGQEPRRASQSKRQGYKTTVSSSASSVRKALQVIHN